MNFIRLIIFKHLIKMQLFLLLSVIFIGCIDTEESGSLSKSGVDKPFTICKDGWERCDDLMIQVCVDDSWVDDRSCGNSNYFCYIWDYKAACGHYEPPPRPPNDTDPYRVDENWSVISFISLPQEMDLKEIIYFSSDNTFLITAYNNRSKAGVLYQLENDLITEIKSFPNKNIQAIFGTASNDFLLAIAGNGLTELLVYDGAIFNVISNNINVRSIWGDTTSDFYVAGRDHVSAYSGGVFDQIWEKPLAGQGSPDWFFEFHNILGTQDILVAAGYQFSSWDEEKTVSTMVELIGPAPWTGIIDTLSTYTNVSDIGLFSSSELLLLRHNDDLKTSMLNGVNLVNGQITIEKKFVQQLNSLWSGDNHIMAIGTNGAIQLYDGNQWQDISVNSSSHNAIYVKPRTLNDIDGPDLSQLYVVGDEGIILKYTP